MPASIAAKNQTAETLPQYRGLIIFTIMVVAIIEVLDSTIVNVTLPSMMGELSANTEQITWVLTSYIVTAAIFIPLTGFFENLLGRKRLLLGCISGFLVASVLCGVATNLPMMVSARVLLGMFGAFLIPLSQAILKDSFSEAEQGKAMAIWGMGIMAAPILGPTLGGIIVEYLNWRWIFYVNIPICLTSLFLTFWVIQDTPKRKQPIDFFGLTLMIIGLGCLQLFLDQGSQHNWLESNTIFGLMMASGMALLLFFIRSLTTANPVVNLRLFIERNFSLSTLILALYAGSLFSTLAMQPILLQSLFNYSAITTGLVMAPRGIASGFAMAIVGGMIGRVNIKIPVAIGIVLSAYGTYMMSQYSLNSDIMSIMWPGVMQGLGMGLLFPPLSTYALNAIPKAQVSQATGLFSYGRMLGASVGISLLATIISQETQINWHRLGGHIQATSPTVQQWLQQHPHLALPAIAQEVYRQANMTAFMDGFWLLSWVTLGLLPLVFLMTVKSTSAIQPEAE